MTHVTPKQLPIGNVTLVRLQPAPMVYLLDGVMSNASTVLLKGMWKNVDLIKIFVSAKWKLIGDLLVYKRLQCVVDVLTGEIIHRESVSK